MMAVMQVHTIDLRFRNRARAIASFLVEGPDGFILIETGPESCRETLLRELASRQIKPEEIAAVFVTHIHLDHAGSAGWWAGQGVPVHVHPKGAKHLVDPERLEASARQVYGEQFDELWGAMVPAPEECIVAVANDELIEVAGLQLRTLETPGHCFHHHAYQLDDVIFAGDAAGAKIDHSDFISVTSAPPQFHLEHTLSSIGHLSARGPKSLYLTHFGEVENPGPHLDSYRDAVELNALFVQQRLAEGMDAEALRVAYEAFQMEQAFRAQIPSEVWSTLQEINGTAMCADGIRLYWEKLTDHRA
ncbi:MAG: MBL fold metallo-hydrolase [Verrucomicrobiales bacterium]|nr:MBL fold metallo-hydrolase [Verrucomicrobiales bacterium]